MHDLPQKPYVYFVPSHTIASIVKIPTGDANTNNLAFRELPCSERDQINISEIITTMAENGKFSLLLKQSYLKQLGVEVNHVHPLKFLSTVFTNAHLKECMRVVFEDYFKRNGFLDGLGPSLSKEAEKGKLVQYAEDFAKEVNVPLEGVLQYFQSRDWENFVRYLMNA